MSCTDNFGEYLDIPAKPITCEMGTGNDDLIVERYAYDHLIHLTGVKRNTLLREGAAVDLALDRGQATTRPAHVCPMSSCLASSTSPCGLMNRQEVDTRS